MNRTRWFDRAAIALTIAVIGGLGLVLHSQQTPTIAVTPAAAHIDRPQPPARQPSVLFIGDSYTGGNGLKEMAYGCMAAVRMGWICDLAAAPGTGYISGGSSNRTTIPYIGPSTSFVERIPSLATIYHPDIVVLDGGRNDLFPPREDVFAAMSGTIAEVRRAWPTATIIFIRPRFLAKPSDDLGFDDNFMGRLESEPAAAGMVVLDPIASFIGTDTSGMLRQDGIHPNKQGEQDLTSALVDSLVSQGFSEKT
jgi:lysophospholipase L1-like esterase